MQNKGQCRNHCSATLSFGPASKHLIPTSTTASSIRRLPFPCKGSDPRQLCDLLLGQALATHRAGGEQPPNDGPAWEDVGAEHLIGGVDHATDVAYEVTAQGLAVRGGQVLPLKPVLVPLLLAEPDLKGKGKTQVLLKPWGKAARTTVCHPLSCCFQQTLLHAMLPISPMLAVSSERSRKQKGHCAAFSRRVCLQLSRRDHMPCVCRHSTAPASSQ